jgi:hypothetical protein
MDIDFHAGCESKRSYYSKCQQLFNRAAKVTSQVQPSRYCCAAPYRYQENRDKISSPVVHNVETAGLTLTWLIFEPSIMTLASCSGIICSSTASLSMFDFAGITSALLIFESPAKPSKNYAVA